MMVVVVTGTNTGTSGAAAPIYSGQILLNKLFGFEELA